MYSRSYAHVPVSSVGVTSHCSRDAGCHVRSTENIVFGCGQGSGDHHPGLLHEFLHPEATQGRATSFAFAFKIAVSYVHMHMCCGGQSGQMNTFCLHKTCASVNYFRLDLLLYASMPNTYTHMHVQTYTHTSLVTIFCVPMYINMHVCVYVCVCMHVCIYLCMYVPAPPKGNEMLAHKGRETWSQITGV